jgi:hypothetical protein
MIVDTPMPLQDASDSNKMLEAAQHAAKLTNPPMQLNQCRYSRLRNEGNTEQHC